MSRKPAAPADSAETMYSSMSNAVKIRTRVAPADASPTTSMESLRASIIRTPGPDRSVIVGDDDPDHREPWADTSVALGNSQRTTHRLSAIPTWHVPPHRTCPHLHVGQAVPAGLGPVSLPDARDHHCHLVAHRAGVGAVRPGRTGLAIAAVTTVAAIEVVAAPFGAGLVSLAVAGVGVIDAAGVPGAVDTGPRQDPFVEREQRRAMRW
jgi:hypothetical protein